MRHWTNQKERGSKIGLLLLIYIMKITGANFIKILVIPISAYYFLTFRAARSFSVDYLRRLNKFSGKQIIWLKLYWQSYLHILSFARAMVDRIFFWQAGVNEKRVISHNQKLIDHMHRESSGGALILVSHLGNFDLAISRGAISTGKIFNVLMDMGQTKIYNYFRGKLFKTNRIRFVDPKSITPLTAIDLIERVQSGQVVVIAADRIDSKDQSNGVEVNFLNSAASFPSGPYVLAHILKVPVYLLFCFDLGDKYIVEFDLFHEQLNLPRCGRQQKIAVYAQHYADILQKHCLSYPLQWYNFFAFWAVKKNVDLKQSSNSNK